MAEAIGSDFYLRRRPRLASPAWPELPPAQREMWQKLAEDFEAAETRVRELEAIKVADTERPRDQAPRLPLIEQLHRAETRASEAEERAVRAEGERDQARFERDKIFRETREALRILGNQRRAASGSGHHRSGHAGLGSSAPDSDPPPAAIAELRDQRDRAVEAPTPDSGKREP